METAKKRYVMAIIHMPIEVINVKTGDFECIQDSATVSIESCDDLPIIDEKEGYQGISEKIRELYQKQEEEEIPIIGVDRALEINEPWENEPIPKEKPVRKNITYRKFSLGHRHTRRNL